MPDDRRQDTRMHLNSTPVNIQRSDAVAEKPPAPPAVPKMIRVTHEHSYYDDAGRHVRWGEGDLITRPDEVKLLVDRAAPHEVIEE